MYIKFYVNIDMRRKGNFLINFLRIHWTWFLVLKRRHFVTFHNILRRWNCSKTGNFLKIFFWKPLRQSMCNKISRHCLFLFFEVVDTNVLWMIEWWLYICRQCFVIAVAIIVQIQIYYDSTSLNALKSKIFYYTQSKSKLPHYKQACKAFKTQYLGVNFWAKSFWRPTLKDLFFLPTKYLHASK